MKGNRTLTVAAFLVLAGMGSATPAAHASSDAAGTTAASFLTLGTGAAALGRGGATLGLAGDVTIASWNAGSLGWIKDTEIALSHGTILEEHTQDYLVAGGRFGAHPLRWAVSGLYESEGTFESRDAFNNPTGSFNVSRLAAGATVAWPIHDVVSLGLGGKWVNESLGDNRGSGVTFDLGLQARWQSFGFGLAAQNVLGQMQYGAEQYDFPTVYGVGVGFDHAATGLRLGVDVNFPNAYYTDVRTGVEYRWRDLAAVRLGYRSELGAPEGETLTGPTFGIGTGFYGMWFDYAYLVPGEAEAQHRIGISLRPSKMNMNQGPFGKADPDYPTQTTTAPRTGSAPKTSSTTAPKTSSTTAPKTPEPASAKSPAAPAPATQTLQPKETKPTVAPVTPTDAGSEVEATPVRPQRITVRAGDTITSIARRWNVSPETLMMYNDLVSPDIHIGQVLKLPPARK